MTSGSVSPPATSSSRSTPWPGGQRPRQLQALALEEAQPAGRLVGLAAEAGPLERIGGQPEAGLAALTGALLRRHQHVLEDGHRLERARHLVRPADPQATATGNVEPGDVVAVEADRARVRAPARRR